MTIHTFLLLTGIFTRHFKWFVSLCILYIVFSDSCNRLYAVVKRSSKELKLNYIYVYIYVIRNKVSLNINVSKQDLCMNNFSSSNTFRYVVIRILGNGLIHNPL